MSAARSIFEELVGEPEGRRLFEQEALLLSATELICELMEKQAVNRTELARRIGKSNAFVSQTLDGRRNMTLRTLADLAWALGVRVQMRPAAWHTEGAPGRRRARREAPRGESKARTFAVGRVPGRVAR
jgi:hypothetical protein